MELLHIFFQKIPMAALFLSVAIGYWIGNFKLSNFSLERHGSGFGPAVRCASVFRSTSVSQGCALSFFRVRRSVGGQCAMCFG